MATFSQRIGLQPMEKAIQIGSIDIELRNTLWTGLTLFLWNRYDANADPYDSEAIARRDEMQTIVNGFYFHILKITYDAMPKLKGSHRNAYSELREIVMSGKWHAVYDLVDYFVRNAPSAVKTDVVEFMNNMLERENSGYRFVDDHLVEITEKSEIQAIEEATSFPAKSTKEHFSRALQFLSDRKNPDFRNSIKESISAVESTAQAVSKNPKATLSDCLKHIKKSKTLHPAFEAALIKLYAWTSDDGGIRHALSDDATPPSYADAKFMLVTCSAFTSYLWTIAAQTKA